MDRPLSLTPSINQVLDRLKGDHRLDEAAPLVRWRGAADLLGLALFFVLLGSYLAANR